MEVSTIDRWHAYEDTKNHSRLLYAAVRAGIPTNTASGDRSHQQGGDGWYQAAAAAAATHRVGKSWKMVSLDSIAQTGAKTASQRRNSVVGTGGGGGLLAFCLLDVVTTIRPRTKNAMIGRRVYTLHSKGRLMPRRAAVCCTGRGGVRTFGESVQTPDQSHEWRTRPTVRHTFIHPLSILH